MAEELVRSMCNQTEKERYPSRGLFLPKDCLFVEYSQTIKKIDIFENDYSASLCVRPNIYPTIDSFLSTLSEPYELHYINNNLCIRTFQVETVPTHLFNGISTIETVCVYFWRLPKDGNLTRFGITTNDKKHDFQKDLEDTTALVL